MSPSQETPAGRGRRETVGEAVARRAAAEEGGRARSGAKGPVATGAKGSGANRAAGRGSAPNGASGARRGSVTTRDGDAPGRAPAPRRRPRRTDDDRGVADPARPARRPPTTEAARPDPSPVHRRRRRVAALVGALVVLAALAVGVRVLLLDLGLFDVEDVQVTGTLDVARADVLAAAAVVAGEPLASVDTAGIASRVAQLPGVGAVEVGRGWPHTVTVAVTERTAVAVVQTPNGPQPVDVTGVVYPAPVPPGLPQLTFGAVGPDDPSTRAALDVLGALPADLRPQVVTVDVALGGGTPQVTLGLTEGRQVRWGPTEESARKAGVLVALLTQPGRVYDVTSPALPTVRS
ncbi:cell division protein FtsQ/DivIB [Pseudonocardia saturnea]